MNTRSFRVRLLSWYSIWILAVFCATSALFYSGLHQYLEQNLANTQTLRAQRIISLLSKSGDAAAPESLAKEISASFAPEVSSRFVRVCEADGKIIYQSGPPEDQSFNPSQISPSPLRIGTRRERLSDGSEMIISCVAFGPLELPGWFVETGESLAPALVELRRLLFFLVCGFAVAAAVALGGGYLLLQRALRPVDEITRSAEGITSRNLSERLPVSATGDEFEHLSLALNRMITRLDEAFQHNRRFLADASHELRTPLTILRGELEGMVKRAHLNSESRIGLGNLLEEVERLSRIVEHLFALSRLDAGIAETAHVRFDLAQLAVTTAEQMCLLAEDKQLAISCHTPAPVFVKGDRARLKQIVVNLLDNAIKYTQNGGAITLTVTGRGRDAVLEVADNGIGIPANAIPHVFDRFFRVDSARSRDDGGAGIGLSIVKAICAAHGGRAELESVEGKGSRFKVFLPLADFSLSPSFAQHEIHP